MEQKTNEYYLKYWSEGYKKYPKAKLLKKIEDAKRRILQVIEKYKNPVLGFSLGKDSIVLRHLFTEVMGLKIKEVTWVNESYEFPEVTKWHYEHCSENSERVDVKFPSFEDLDKDEDMLFPKSSKEQNRWFSAKWSSQRSYLKSNNHDLFITGRRLSERNRCGKENENFVVKGNGYDTFSPIADWDTEDIICYLKVNNLELPPNYFYKDGFVQGSGSWAESVRYLFDPIKTMDEMLEEVFEIDSNILFDCRGKLHEVDRFLKKKGI